MISVSLSKLLDPTRQTRFSRQEPRSFCDWEKILLGSVWSPIVWKENIRVKVQYDSCEYIALDLDNGVTTLKEAVEFCRDNGLAHIIATTRSHQREKVSPSGKREPACDRFRMILRADSPQGDRELYEYNMAEMISYFSADPSCKDAGRFFYPCREVVSSGTGRTVPWKPYDPDYTPESQRYERRRERLKQYSKVVLPQWVRNILTGGTVIPAGERHVTCYRLGATLSVIGFSEHEAGSLLLQAKSLAAIGEHELRRAVANGWRKEQGHT